METSTISTTVNEISVSYKKKTVSGPIKSSRTASDLFKKFITDDVIEYKEYFYVAYLSNSNEVLGVCKISEGGITGTTVDVRLIFGIALKTNAVGMILCHNHPSGTLKPSEADKSLTYKIQEAGQTLDIKLLDHIIVTSSSYYSFADDGIL